jgi:hypothetical protein
VDAFKKEQKLINNIQHQQHTNNKQHQEHQHQHQQHQHHQHQHQVKQDGEVGGGRGREVTRGRVHHELVRSSSFLSSPAVIQLMSSFQPLCKEYFQHRYKHIHLSTVQIVESSDGSIDQPYHADNVNRGLTFVIPLTDITVANGPTQLLSRSHDMSVTNILLHSRVVNPLLRVNDLLVFDARLLHRGLANNTSTNGIINSDDPTNNASTNSSAYPTSATTTTPTTAPPSAAVRSILVFRYDDRRTPPPGARFLGALWRHHWGGFCARALHWAGRSGHS